jgi:ABC-type amino acid transport substrate-binding protein
MKTLLSILLSLLVFQMQAQEPKLELASDVWPPFTDDMAKKTVALDLVKEALNRTGIAATFAITSFDEVIDGIDAGDFDGSAALWADNERMAKYFFSIPYLHNQMILVGNKGSDVSAGTIEALQGKRIGIVANYAYGFSDDTQQKVTFVKGESNQQNLERLFSGQIDYMLVDALLIQYMLKYQVNDVSEHLEIGDQPLMVKSLHFALRKDVPEAENIISGFNNAIQNMLSDGSYHRILELNWIRADIDGDGEVELVLDGNRAGLEAPTNTYGVYSGETLALRSQQNDRFYIEGKVYDGWENVPQKYKDKILQRGVANPRDAGFKLDFDK